MHEHRTYLNKFDQAKQLTLLRRDDAEFNSMSCAASQVTIIRLDNAYKRFFKGDHGAPKFAGRNFESFDYASGGKGLKGNSWKLEWTGEQKGRVYLSDVGTIRFRGAKEPVTCRQVGVIRRDGRWYLQIVGDRIPKAKTGTKTLAIDMGVKTFLSGTYGDLSELESPKLAPFNEAAARIKTEQRKLRKKKKFSNRWKKQQRVIARLQSGVAKKRKNVHNQLSAKIAQECSTVITETLNIKGMTANGGAYKKGLNRHILDAGIGQFLLMLKYKVEERGGEFIVCETRGLAPTQRCHACWHRAPKTLADRVHDCKNCGMVCDRDMNAARVMLQFASPQTGTRQASLFAS